MGNGSQRINGKAFAELRKKAGLTQLQLASLSGYSVRVIRKAESGGQLRIETIRDLSQCLSTVNSAVHAHELVLSNRDLALQFVQAYDDYGIEMVKHCKQILADNIELHCPGDPGQVSFVGVWRGPSGIQEFFNRFFAFFSRRSGSLAPMCFESQDRVVIRYVDQVYFEGHPMPPFWVNLHFQFLDGKIVRIDDEYDTRAASESFLELLKQLGRI